MFKKSVTFTAIFIGIFAGLFVANSTLVKSTHAYELTVTNSGNTILEPENGQVVTKTSEITVKTDCRAGYTLQIQGPADTNLYLDGDATKNETDKFIKPVNATSALNAQPNTYGYNLTTNQTDQIFTPLTSTAVTLKDFTDTASPSADINDTNNIHWGVNAGMTLNAGTYILADNEAVTYIVTTSPTCVNYYNVSFDPNGGSGAQMPTQQITENTPTTLTKNTYTSSNDQDGFIGWNTQPDGSGTHYTDEQEVTLSGSDQNITLYAQWNCPASKICYFDNGASSPTTMDNQSASSNTATTLWPSNFQRKGYGFAGWAETPTPTTTDTIYGPQQTLTATEVGDLTTKGKKLYAVWIEAKDTIQNWTGCPKLTQATYSNGTVTANLSSVTALLDTRDGEAYAVAKLPDGNCWMIENLRLGSNTTITLTSNDTSINANLTFPASTTSFSNSYNTINSIRQNAINKLNTVANMTGTNANIYSYGVYYTWPAAIGSTSAYSSGSVSTSICPRGWTLPLGNTTSSGSFGALDVSIGGTGSNQNVSSAVFNRWRSYPNNFVYSGGYYTSRYSYRGSGAVYWTRTLYGESYGLNLLIDTGSSRILPGDAHDTKYNGETIRCIARSDYYTITFDKNGGTGTMPDQAIYRNTSTALNPATFTAPKSWQTFLGWNTEPDGTGTSYTNAESITNLANNGETITLYAQWGCPPGNICYDKNGAANSPTNMGRQSVGDSDTSAPLWPSNFQRSGYGFAGWNTKADGTGTMYGPNETIFDDATINNIKTDGLALYATWIKSAGDIQGWDGCATMNIGDVTALTDKRDNKTYAVAKLADGKCWMTENLRLDNQYTTSAEDIALSQGYGTGFIGLAEPEFSNFDYSTASNSLYSAADVNNNNTQMPRYNNINTANAVETLTSWTGTENIYSLGNYYTWTAIVANVDKVLIRNVSLSSISICPAGWRLPRGGDKNNQANNDVWDLIVNHFNNGVPPSNYNNTDQPIYLNEGEELIKIMTKYPNNFVYSGRYEKDSPNNRSTIGSFWTSTFYSEYGNAYNFGMVSFSKSVNPGTSSASKFTGMPARCVLDERYTVSFDANGGSGDMADQSIQVGIATKLSANTFTNTEPFVGWNTKPDGTGDSYTNEQEVTDLVGKGETITLYAQWAEPTPLGQISTMQEMTSGICSATPVGTEAALKDTRDGKTYSVAKLEDGNCWMTEDLDHDIDATKTYTPADTDISSNWTPDVSTINIQGLNVGESVAGWVGAFGDNGLASADPGEVYWDGSASRHSRIGNYYNWTAALAVNDSGAYSNGTETDPSQNPQTSICPKGWRLPIIANEITGHVDEFKELNRLYNNGVNSTDSGLIASPLYFTRGGAIDQSSELQGVGNAGSYWSSTAGGPMYVFNTAYYFNHNAGYNDSYSSNIAYGYNIRCVARQSYTVSFNANSGSGNMADQIIARGISAKLKANEFSAPSGFVFDGWNTEANGSGTSYANEATVTNLADSGGTITLYAQWKDTRTGFDRIMTMQDMTSAICAEAAVGDTKRLRDTRDDKYYNIRKMEDGKCWMVQNLALTSPNGYTLTPADSDVSSEFVIEPGVINSTGETWRDEYEDKKHIFDAGNTWIEPTSAGSNANVKTTGTPPNEGQYIGAYYSYYVATAGTGPRSLESGDAPSSICPKGWKLPTSGTTTSDWAGLTGALVGITSNTTSASAQSFALQNAPAYLGMFGLFDAGSMGVLNQGSETYYMSSSVSARDGFYALRLGPKRIDPGNMAGVKRSGNVIRCVAR